MMKQMKHESRRPARSSVLKGSAICVLIGLLAACGGGGGESAGTNDSALLASSLVVQEASGASTETRPVAKVDRMVQSANPAMEKVAERKCIKQARTEVGKAAAQKSDRRAQRKEMCDNHYEKLAGS
jgi:hypothetical protein